jgi:hypothetical protein
MRLLVLLALVGAAPVVRSAEPPRPRAFVPADSLPSRDALRVLESIPEPAGVSPRAPVATRDSVRTVARDTIVVRDTVATPAASADTAGVPVPEPTAPLVAPEVTLAPPDTAAVSAAAAPAPVAPPALPESRPGECLRLQVSAPVEPALAASRRDAAQSLLLVPMTIELEAGLHKVRSRDCLTREAGEALKRRALEAGFDGAFLVDTSTPSKVTPATPPAPAKKKPARATSRRSRTRSRR